MAVKSFSYTRADGKKSKRSVFVIHPANKNMFGIDLSEFPEEERLYYEQQLNNLYDSVDAEIKNMGLSTCFRSFKPEKISK